MLSRTLALIAMVPALAFAQPKKPPKKTPKKATPTQPEPAKDTPPDAPDATNDDSTKDKDKDKDAGKDKDKPANPAGAGGGANGGTGSGGGAPDTSAKDKPAANEPDVDALRQEYLSLRDELFKSRARANAVASQLYSTRLQVKLTYTTARYYNPAKASIRLDGATIFEDASGAIGGDDGIRFDGYVAPGKHLLTFRIEATGKDDDTFTSTTETQVVVKAVAGKDLVVAAKAKDGGDIAYEWKKSEHGSYGLGVDVAVKTIGHEEKGAKK
jgi:hypothetical protein